MRSLVILGAVFGPILVSGALSNDAIGGYYLGLFAGAMVMIWADVDPDDSVLRRAERAARKVEVERK